MDTAARPSTPRSDHRLPIVVFGSATCEDTAITDSRLRAVGIAREYVDIDADPESAARVERLNGGRRVTPTLVVGDEDAAVSEPTLEQLAELVTSAGHEYEAPSATQLHGVMTTRPLPLRTVPNVASGDFSLGAWRGRHQVVLFLAHGAACLPCFGYARQLAMQEAGLRAADARAVVVVPGTPGDGAAWREHVDAGTAVVADPDAGWKTAIAAAVAVPRDSAIVLVLDRFLAPRALSAAVEAGGLIDPSAATGWLEFFALECPECSGEIEWPVDEPD